MLELDNNEAAFSLCVVAFASLPSEPPLLAVGTAQGMTFYPRQVEGRFLSLGFLGILTSYMFLIFFLEE